MKDQQKTQSQFLSEFFLSAVLPCSLFDADFNLVEINEAGLKIFPPGTLKEDILGKNILQIAPALQGSERYKRYKEVIKSGKPFTENNVVTDPDFGEKHLNISAFKVGDGIGFIFNDVSLQIQSEKELNKHTTELKSAYEQLKEVDTLKTNFLDLVSHELNSPLMEISSSLELLSHDTENFHKEEVQDLLETVNLGTARLNKIIRDILDLTKLEAGKLCVNRQDVDLALIVKINIASVAEALAERNLKLVFDKPPEQLIVKGDPTRLEQAFQNLINNAIKYTPDQKAIKISLKKHGLKWAEVSIEDEGIGVPESMQEKIFQPFFEGTEINHHSTGETKFMGGGLGLGLSISEKIIMYHGGNTTMKSEGEFKGSTFIVRLPLV